MKLETEQQSWANRSNWQRLDECNGYALFQDPDHQIWWVSGPHAGDWLTFAEYVPASIAFEWGF